LFKAAEPRGTPRACPYAHFSVDGERTSQIQSGANAGRFEVRTGLPPRASGPHDLGADTYNGRPMQAAIEARGLSKRFGRTWALAQVSFAVPSGSVLLVAGRNGSGKTTLFRVLSTALRPDGGSARVAGLELRERDRIRRRTALLTHQAYSYESLSAAENLRIFARLCGLGGVEVEDLLAAVGLEAHPQPVSSFSAGMRKRLGLARILLQLSRAELSVVFLDEPYAALDVEGLALVDDLILRLKREEKTIVVASHQLERAAALASHAILLDSGRLAWSGPASQLSRQPMAQKAV
jgi:heme exporter protein A